ncbi:MAG: YeeE/YedE family protein [Polyangiaceae bacterium]
MTYWPFWEGGAALAGVMLLHWLMTGRMMAVSGRFTALVNRLRSQDFTGDAEGPLDERALIAAMRAATVEQYGEAAVGASLPTAAASGPVALPAQRLSDHLLFLACLVLGGLGASLSTTRFHVVPLLSSTGFSQLTHGSAAAGAAVLLAGGVCVGFGTRMAGGCTSGHGMCGVSRLQPGSLLATAAFFGTGVLTAFALGWLR